MKLLSKYDNEYAVLSVIYDRCQLAFRLQLFLSLALLGRIATYVNAAYCYRHILVNIWNILPNSADISRSALCCHSNETRAPIANPAVVLCTTRGHHSPKLHPGPCSSVGMRRGKCRQTRIRASCYQ